MRIEENYSLLHHNTFGIDVKCRWFMEYDSIDELCQLLKREEVKRGPVLHIGSGSNLLFLSDFDGVILHSRIDSFEVLHRRSGKVLLKVGSGVIWDDVCAYAAKENLGGVENLSAIPGEVGAAAVQNIGAYGAEIKDVIQQVTVMRISDGKLHHFSVSDCEYGYRDSVFKGRLRGEYIVVYVELKLDIVPEFDLTYGALHRLLATDPNPTVQQVRDLVIETRKAKLPDPQLLGNAGSFFKNPVITNDQYFKLLERYKDMPSYMLDDNMVKIPAAWLIEACGWKGKRIEGAGVYDHQSLVLVNYGGATARSIGKLAHAIVASVYDKFGIELFAEVNYIGECIETETN